MTTLNITSLKINIFLILWIVLYIGSPSVAMAGQIAILRPVQYLTGSDVVVLGSLGLGQNFSFSFWVKPSPTKVTPNWAAIIDYRHNSTKSFAFHQKENELNHFAFGIHSKNGVHGVYAGLTYSEWQHIALVKGTGSMAIFVNGEVVDRTEFKPSFHIDYAGDEILTIGGWGYGSRRWLGEVSCVYVFDSSISEKEIRALSKQTECKS